MGNNKTLYPRLQTINSPEDLRKLQVNELPQVCKELRQFLINSLSDNPGHFASSMGAVDLTVALHYVFNTPYDRIVWDVGHQAYAHKILTGRRDAFANQRKYNGISGFPNPAESEYDTFTAGHASNSISAALGMSVASGLSGDTPRRNVVAVIGDASISGGLAFEGLNNTSINKSSLLIILNDNDMSIDVNVGAFSSYLGQLNTTKGYNNFRYKTFKLLKRLHLVNDRHKGLIMRFNNSLKSLLASQQNIFEGLNIRYFGPIDGNDVERVVRVLTDIKDMEGPKLLHLKTVKGKGYKPAEDDPASWHAPGKFNPATGQRAVSSGENKPIKFQDVFGNTLVELGEKNKKIVGITAAMLSGTSVSTFQHRFPERTFDVGISEGHAITFAGGLAKDGQRPFVAIYSAFLQRAYDNIIHDVAIPHLPVTICIDRAGLVGEDGVTHHGLYDIAYLRPIPGMIIAAPRDERWLRNLMYTAQSSDNNSPFVIRYPRGKGENPDWQTPMESVKIGHGEKLRDGNDINLLSLGTMARHATSAIEQTQSKGIGTAHYDMVFAKPLDENILHEVAKNGKPIITVEDGAIEGGFGQAVNNWMINHGYSPRIVNIGVPDKFVAHGTVDQLMAECHMDSQSIADTICELYNESRNRQ